MNGNIKVEFHQYNNFVCGRVLDMPEELRAADEIISSQDNKFSIRSCNYPSLFVIENDVTILFLKGLNTSSDNKWFYHQFNSYEEAANTIDAFKELIDEWNKNRKNMLTEKEKKYLSDVIKPFRDKTITIIKRRIYANGKDYIAIHIYNDSHNVDTISLPLFENNTMYKNMTPNQEYSLERLGLL